MMLSVISLGVACAYVPQWHLAAAPLRAKPFLSSLGASPPAANELAHPEQYASELMAHADAASFPLGDIPLTRRCVAELIGTACLVISIFGIAKALKLRTFFTAVVAGSTVGTLVRIFGSISGAHLNPAITLALAAGNKFPRTQVPVYLLSQTVGATLAYALVSSFIVPSRQLPLLVPFGEEVRATIMLAFGCFAIGDAADAGMIPQPVKPVLIGILITSLSLIVRAGMNPALTAAPFMVTLLRGWGPITLADAWHYAVGPAFGGLLGTAALAFARGEGRGVFSQVARVGRMNRRALGRMVGSVK